jgi:hypothetical protein
MNIEVKAFANFPLEERPALLEEIFLLRKRVCPRFVLLPSSQMLSYYEKYPDLQIIIKDTDSSKVIAFGNSLPYSWNGSVDNLPENGLEAVMESLLVTQPHDQNTLCGVSMTIDPDYRGKKLSKLLIRFLKSLAHEKVMSYLVFPLRPPLKATYPNVEMEEYIAWKTDEGQVFDPWLRAHMNEGATFKKICPRSVTITHNLQTWKLLTGKDFNKNEANDFPYGLSPLHVDLNNQTGTYFEPNIWVSYSIGE